METSALQVEEFHTGSFIIPNKTHSKTAESAKHAVERTPLDWPLTTLNIPRDAAKLSINLRQHALSFPGPRTLFGSRSRIQVLFY